LNGGAQGDIDLFGLSTQSINKKWVNKSYVFIFQSTNIVSR
jgi:hypothetical protein